MKGDPSYTTSKEGMVPDLSKCMSQLSITEKYSAHCALFLAVFNSLHSATKKEQYKKFLSLQSI